MILLTLIRKICVARLVISSIEYSTMAVSSHTPVVLVHGGAGDIPDSAVQEKLEGVKAAARAGHDTLARSGSLLDAIEAAIHIMEDLPGFNAGRGSVLNLDGGIEMEALITEGKHFNAGAVTLLRNVKHPISVARLVMEKSPHTLLGGDGLNTFVNTMGVERVAEYTLLTQRAIDALERFKAGPLTAPSVTELPSSRDEGGVGTVGCVAVDSAGHVASGTSTGGITGKYKGRIGDTPLPGCGGYSDDEIGAVSTTGHGESILKFNLAHRILSYIHAGMSAEEATRQGCQQMTARVGKTAGAITVTNRGDVGISFTSKRMAWAYQLNNELHYGIDPDQHLVDQI